MRCSDACSVADKEDCSIISKEDSTAWRKNTRKVIYEERKKSGTKNRALRDTRGCSSGRGCGIEHTSDLETPRVFFNSKYLFNTRKKIIAQYNKWWVQTTTHELPHQQRSAFLNKDDIFLLLIYRVRRRGNLSLTRRTRTLSSWSTAANKTR